MIYSEILHHYYLKLVEISDLKDSMDEYLSQSVLIARESWEGEAADGFFEAVSRIQKESAEMKVIIDDLFCAFGRVKAQSTMQTQTGDEH